MRITCEVGKLFRRGRGPPPVPRRISRVLAGGEATAVTRQGCIIASANTAPVREKNSRREYSQTFSKYILNALASNYVRESLYDRLYSAKLRLITSMATLWLRVENCFGQIVPGIAH